MDVNDDQSGKAKPEPKSRRVDSDEIRDLEALYASCENEEKYIVHLSEPDRQWLKARSFRRIMLRVDQVVAAERRQRMRTRWVAAAAVVVLVFLSGVYFFHEPAGPVAETVVVDALPGSNRAMLMLPDGRRISLDDVNNGQLTQEHGIRIMKTGDGIIQYELGASAIGSSASARIPTPYHTVVTPPGGQFSVVLPDSTVVWLNASSSLRYPPLFSDSARVVELEGEAYFAVKSISRRSGVQAAIPFIVRTAACDVLVTGTEFNVNAYPDEPAVRTSLVSGSVSVLLDGESGQQRVVLKPGQQASVESDNVTIKMADMAAVSSWKNGFFYFNNTDLYSLVRQFARWYDVDVTFADGIKNDFFFGRVPRSYTLSEALQVLEFGDIRFRIVQDKAVSGVGRKKLILEP